MLAIFLSPAGMPLVFFTMCMYMQVNMMMNKIHASFYLSPFYCCLRCDERTQVNPYLELFNVSYSKTVEYMMTIEYKMLS
jgi:hypothetical protein